jgi:flagellar motor switch protein FliM
VSDYVADNSQVRAEPYEFGAAAARSQPALDELHAAFARDLSAAISRHLRGVVDVAFSFAEQIRYDEFLHSIGEVSCLSVLRIDRPGADACLDLSLPVIYPLFVRLLGGPADATTTTPHRPLTQIEQGLALQIIERAASVLAETWGRAAPLVVREQSLESSPADVRIMPGSEVVTVARFDVRFGAAGGTISLCIPAPVVQYLREIPPPLRSPAERDEARQNLEGNLLKAAVELRALLAETKLRLSDVLSMQVGDVITTEKLADETVPLQVEGKEKFAGRLGQYRGVRAVAITRGPNDKPPESET